MKKETIISIGTDRKIFISDSAVSKRQQEYANNLGYDICVIVFTLKNMNLKAFSLGSNVDVYPTNSYSKLSYIYDSLVLYRKIIKDRKVILVTSQDPFECGFVAWFISLLYKVPFHLQIHTDFLNKFFTRLSILNRIRSIIANTIIPKASGLRVVSTRIAMSLSKKFSKLPPMHVIPIFIDPLEISSKFEVAKQDFLNDKNIVWFGRFENEKNPFLALEVIKKIIKIDKNIKLIMIGDGSLKNGLYDYVEKNGLGQNVIFKPWQENIIPSLKSANLCLSTSWYEGYGLGIVETVLSKCPLVTTDTGILGFMLDSEKSAKVCNPGDLDCLANTCMELLENPDLSKAMADHAYDELSSKMPTKDKFIQDFKNNIEESIRFSK